MFSHLIEKESKETEQYSKQSYGYSCAAFACSLVFCALLKNAGQAISKKMQFALEAGIYQTIWSTPGQKADEQRCFQFLQDFVRQPIASYLLSDIAKIERIQPHTAEILFCKKGDYHEMFICSVMENTCPVFLIVDDDQPTKQSKLPKELTQVLQIPLVDFNVKKIKDWSESAERKIIETIFNYPETFLQPLYKIKMIREYFPEQKNKLAACILAAHEKLIYSLADIDEFCDLFPEQRKEAAQLVMRNEKKFLTDSQNIAKFLSAFSDFPAVPNAVASYLIRENKIETLVALGKKLAHVTEMRNQILQFALESDALNSQDKRYIRSSFPDYKEKQKVGFFAKLWKKDSTQPSTSHLRSLFPCRCG